MWVSTPSTFSSRLPTKCFKKFIQTHLENNESYKELHEYLVKYPFSLDQSSKSFDCIGNFSHGVDHSNQTKHPNYTYNWSKYDRPAPSAEIMKQIVLAYLEYRIYFSNN